MEKYLEAVQFTGNEPVNADRSTAAIKFHNHIKEFEIQQWVEEKGGAPRYRLLIPEFDYRIAADGKLPSQEENIIRLYRIAQQRDWIVKTGGGIFAYKYRPVKPDDFSSNYEIDGPA